MGQKKKVVLHMTPEKRRDVLVRAAQQGLSLKEYITDLIVKDMAKKRGGNTHE